MSLPSPPDAARRDLWIPAGFVLFFVALAGLQLWFVLLANRSFTGLVTDPPARARPAGPEGSADVAFSPSGPLTGHLVVRLRDATGVPRDPHSVSATIERTTRFPQLLPVTLRRIDNGAYAADLTVPLAGPWTVRLVTQTTDGRQEHLATVEVEP